jgi:hypothetical protein
MTELLIVFAIFLVILPAVFGWLITLRAIVEIWRIRRERKHTERTVREVRRIVEAFSRVVNDGLDAHGNIRSPLNRRRELHAVSSGKQPNCEIVDTGPDGPKAA